MFYLFIFNIESFHLVYERQFQVKIEDVLQTFTLTKQKEQISQRDNKGPFLFGLQHEKLLVLHNYFGMFFHEYNDEQVKIYNIYHTMFVLLL